VKVKELYKECWEITKSKGFDVSMMPEQIMLIASECAEALAAMRIDEVPAPEASESMLRVVDEFRRVMATLEAIRRHKCKVTKLMFTLSSPHADPRLADRDTAELARQNFLEELADIQIRLASFVEGNGLTDEFLAALRAKMEKNKTRPHKHGKSF